MEQERDGHKMNLCCASTSTEVTGTFFFS